MTPVGFQLIGVAGSSQPCPLLDGRNRLASGYLRRTGRGPSQTPVTQLPRENMKVRPCESRVHACSVLIGQAGFQTMHMYVVLVHIAPPRFLQGREHHGCISIRHLDGVRLRQRFLRSHFGSDHPETLGLRVDTTDQPERCQPQPGLSQTS